MDWSNRDPIQYTVALAHKNQPLKRYLDLFTRFAQLIRVPNTQTDIQTTLHVTSVATGRICYAMRPKSLLSQEIRSTT